MSRRFVSGSAIRYARVDDLGVILDLRTSSYKVLDDVATAMWERLTRGVGTDDSWEALCAEYDMDPETIQRAATGFIDTCLADGLLQDAAQAHVPDLSQVATERPTGMGRFVPRAARAFFCLADTQRRLSTDGFTRTYQHYARFGCRSGNGSPDASVSAFLGAESWFFSKRAAEDCLLRSLALYRFLRDSGIVAEHVIGVQRVPFLAHAWVECGGTVMLDDRVAGFTPLARIGIGIGTA